MSDSRPIPTAERLDEELVAYLDGELAPQAAQQIEDMLAGNETARRRLNELATSWDLLDQLPRATVDELFTRTTVEMVAVDAEGEIAKRTADAPVRRKRRLLATGLAALLAVVAGFAIVSIALPDQNDALLRDLPIVENFEYYHAVGDLAYLKRLDETGLFTVAPNDVQPATAQPRTSRHPMGTFPTSIGARRSLVESLSAADKLDLRSQYDHFDALSEHQQQALRQFHDELAADPHSAQLRRVMERYYDWLKSLSRVDRAELEDEENSQKRIELVKQLHQTQEGQVFARLLGGSQPYVLNDADNEAVLAWMRKHAVAHADELDEEAAKDRRADSGKAEGRPRRRPPMILAWQMWWSPEAKKSPTVSPAELQELRETLSPQRQAQLDAETGLSDRVKLVREWLRVAGRELNQFAAQALRRWGPGGPGPERLKRFETELTPQEKQSLENLSEPERNRQLLKMFMERRRPGGPPPGNPTNEPAGPRSGTPPNSTTRGGTS
jgi:hypothetical protein